ncbi:YifB family Mg chelatase-like AAA ATPase [Paludibacterium purpuratum]|uniref:Magnesium chelatase family protein n=1 Tax=Paludibacterium purpuratum TaxID=1144873 RepID=A0A4R7B6A0_9NEIS|nr:YifB family Mg chelatase-like AAA ATPase [Paludibacterium purpuratum]TDR80158.1 magnesium chelatase family protein [Paludibacterium purpuratum]
MNLAVVHSRALDGAAAPEVAVEVHLGTGLPAFHIVGLPDTEVKESRDRVRSAIQTSGFEFPARKIIVSLAPADLPKASGRFDLPIALGILAASGQVASEPLTQCEFAGELALSGGLRSVRGALAMAWRARHAGRVLILPTASAREAALVSSVTVLQADSLLQVCAHLNGRQPLPIAESDEARAMWPMPDMSEVKGQASARHALELAAAGGHSLLMIGAPGTGKSMLASRLPGILPPLGDDEALECAALHSLSAQGFDPACWRQPPFRAPHHGSSVAALVGGGSVPQPGEISLAHHGVLFLDEMPEFERRALEALREPLETGQVHLARATRRVSYPARFQLVAAMNPCPCGYAGDETGRCQCTPEQISRYRGKISGPLLDRIDMQVEMASHSSAELLRSPVPESSSAILQRVMAARERQCARQGKVNALLRVGELEQICQVEPGLLEFLSELLARLRLSARALHRILRLSQTIADLAEAGRIGRAHVLQAVQLRRQAFARQ